ncbi:hypothetical protein HYN43_011200 [Mucilaginibacter celer]|uniref:Uncharacterized protein n=2 Tax=Mucilaginibacter celer TaxID=2305508 RepID=A0A494VNP0_9SPHI|nr:hypothetical protein HYN43_011200 [Mucilaginibacter celer]
MSSSPDVKLPPAEQGFVDQFHRAVMLVPDSLSDDRKQFLEDSLKNTIDQWLSKKTGLKADRWLGVVMNDTVGQSLGANDGSVLQLYIPIPNAAGSRYDVTRSVVLTMSVDEDDKDMYKARRQLTDGDTAVFSGYFSPMSGQVSDVLSHPGNFLANPSLDFTLTELYKKSASLPPARPEPDTLGLAKAPVKVTAAIVAKRVSGSRFINIKVKIKNTSNKAITKLSVRWLVTNKKGDPAKVNGATGAYQQGYLNNDLQPGAIITGEWQHESPDGEKVKLIFPKWVTFYNGTQWKTGRH